MLHRFRKDTLSALVLPLLAAVLVSMCGCAEGPLWRAGKYSPWARNQWAAEEQIADTLFVQKRRMSEAVSSVAAAPVEDQQKVAQNLANVMHQSPVLLLRLHAVKLLGQLNCPAATQALVDASHDHNSDLRIQAINSWQAMPADKAIPHLQDMIGSDTEVDVRLAATRALSNFSGERAVSAIAMALEDPNPALQLRAVESLQVVTGEQIGRDVGAWQQYVKNVLPAQQPISSTSQPLDSIPQPASNEFIADQTTSSTTLFR